MLKIIFCISCFLTLCISQVHAAINYTITPIRYELELEPGESATFPASIRNNGPDSVTLPTTTSDFQSNGPNGVPSIVRKSELVYPDQELSTWISLSDTSVTLAPGEEKTIMFTIDVPVNATPGGHYGAVLFRNPGSETSTTGSVGINVDYGIIILVDVEWELIVDVEIDPPIISGGGGWWGWGGGWWSGWSGDSWIYTNEPEDENAWYVGEDIDWNPLYENPDDCPLWDLTPSRFDGKCIWNIPFIQEETSEESWENQENWEDATNTTVWNISSENNSSDPQLFSQDFWITFDFPITNQGNSHVKPEWKITLIDEDGNTLKAVGKKAITNKAWAIIGEEVVDYIPINDEWGNVLPKTERIFQSEWKWFPYKEYNETGDQIIQYKNPGAYYNEKNKQWAWFLMFWERVCEVRTQKNVTANIELEYLDENGDPIIFSSAQEFPIQYIEEQVRLNPYVILGLLLLFTALLLILCMIRWWFIFAKNSKCWNCKKSIKSHWDTCPYCRKIQNKKKQKKLEEQMKEPAKKPKKKKK